MKGKKFILVFIIFFIIFGNLSFLYNFLNFNGNSINLINKIDLKNAESSIIIDDLDPTKNWSYTASHYDWCSGSGSKEDPYIIENITIDGLGIGSCIYSKFYKKFQNFKLFIL